MVFCSSYDFRDSFRYWMKCRGLRLVLGAAFSLVIVFRHFSPFSPISLFGVLPFRLFLFSPIFFRLFLFSFFANDNIVQ